VLQQPFHQQRYVLHRPEHRRPPRAHHRVERRVPAFGIGKQTCYGAVAEPGGWPAGGRRSPTAARPSPSGAAPLQDATRGAYTDRRRLRPRFGLRAARRRFGRNCGRPAGARVLRGRRDAIRCVQAAPGAYRDRYSPAVLGDVATVELRSGSPEGPNLAGLMRPI